MAIKCRFLLLYEQFVISPMHRTALGLNNCVHLTKCLDFDALAAFPGQSSTEPTSIQASSRFPGTPMRGASLTKSLHMP